MIDENWSYILGNQEVRQNLSKIRQEIKVQENLELFIHLIQGEESRFIDLLDSEDAKTRKNAALLMGDIGKAEFLTPIFMAYEKEEQRFVKSAYLAAMKNFDYSEYMEEFKMRLEVLNQTEVTKENQKHLMEEMRELSSLILLDEGIEPHTFIGWEETSDIILLANRNFTECVREELLTWEPNAVTKLFSAGIIARVEHLNWIDKIRTYQELLFIVEGMKTCPMNLEEAAEIIAKSSLLQFLNKRHIIPGEKKPFYFRVEMKSKMELDEKSSFVKKLSGFIERFSNRELINSTDQYEVEIRLIENKEGNCNVLVKLFTIRDKRFTYRKEFLPTSIRPVNAALTVALVKEYLKEDAQILDPFCGVGTMLAERQKAVKVHSAYGLDIQEDAIEKAKKNAEIAKQIVHYINRDFFRFQHDYLFDEVITNMPFQIGRISSEEVYEIYDSFFVKVQEHLKADGVIILYSHDREIIRALAAPRGFTVLEEYEISKREGTYVFVLGHKK